MDSKRFQELVEESTYNHGSFADLFTCGVCDMKMWADNIHEHLQSHISVCTNYQFNTESKTIIPVFESESYDSHIAQKRKLPMASPQHKQKICVTSPRSSLYSCLPQSDSQLYDRGQRSDSDVENYLNPERLTVILDQVQQLDSGPAYFAAKPYPSKSQDIPVGTHTDAHNVQNDDKKKNKKVKTNKSVSKTTVLNKHFESNVQALNVGDYVTKIDIPYVVDGKELGTYHCSVVIDSYTPHPKALPQRGPSGKFIKQTKSSTETMNIMSGEENIDNDFSEDFLDNDATQLSATPLGDYELHNAIDSINGILGSPNKQKQVPQKKKKKKVNDIEVDFSKKVFVRQNQGQYFMVKECKAVSWTEENLATLIDSELKREMYFSFGRLIKKSEDLKTYFAAITVIKSFNICTWAMQDLEKTLGKHDIGIEVNEQEIDYFYNEITKLDIKKEPLAEMELDQAKSIEDTGNINDAPDGSVDMITEEAHLVDINQTTAETGLDQAEIDAANIEIEKEEIVCTASNVNEEQNRMSGSPKHLEINRMEQELVGNRPGNLQTKGVLHRSVVDSPEDLKVHHDNLKSPADSTKEYKQNSVKNPTAESVKEMDVSDMKPNTPADSVKESEQNNVKQKSTAENVKELDVSGIKLKSSADNVKESGVNDVKQKTTVDGPKSLGGNEMKQNSTEVKMNGISQCLLNITAPTNVVNYPLNLFTFNPYQTITTNPFMFLQQPPANVVYQVPIVNAENNKTAEQDKSSQQETQTKVQNKTVPLDGIHAETVTSASEPEIAVRKNDYDHNNYGEVGLLSHAKSDIHPEHTAEEVLEKEDGTYVPKDTMPGPSNMPGNKTKLTSKAKVIVMKVPESKISKSLLIHHKATVVRQKKKNDGKVENENPDTKSNTHTVSNSQYCDEMDESEISINQGKKTRKEMEGKDKSVIKSQLSVSDCNQPRSKYNLRPERKSEIMLLLKKKTRVKRKIDESELDADLMKLDVNKGKTEKSENPERNKTDAPNKEESSDSDVELASNNQVKASGKPKPLKGSKSLTMSKTNKKANDEGKANIKEDQLQKEMPGNAYDENEPSLTVPMDHDYAIEQPSGQNVTVCSSFGMVTQKPKNLSTQSVSHMTAANNPQTTSTQSVSHMTAANNPQTTSTQSVSHMTAANDPKPTSTQSISQMTGASNPQTTSTQSVSQITGANNIQTTSTQSVLQMTAANNPQTTSTQSVSQMTAANNPKTTSTQSVLQMTAANNPQTTSTQSVSQMTAANNTQTTSTQSVSQMTAANNIFIPFNNQMVNIQQPIIPFQPQIISPFQQMIPLLTQPTGIPFYNPNTLMQQNSLPFIPQQNLLTANAPQFVIPSQWPLSSGLQTTIPPSSLTQPGLQGNTSGQSEIANTEKEKPESISNPEQDFQTVDHSLQPLNKKRPGNIFQYYRKYMEEKGMKCGLCKKAIRNKEEWVLHVQDIHTFKEVFDHYLKETKSFVCCGCGHLSTNKLKLKNHLFKCYRAQGCGFSKFDIEGYEYQARFQYNRPCRFCNRTFTCKKRLKEHKPNCSSLPILKCDLCSVKVRTEEALALHKEKKHTTCNKVTYSCDLCNKTFTFQRYLDQHNLLKHEKKGMNARNITVCEICGKAMYNKAGYRTHMKRIHELRHQCLYCGLTMHNGYSNLIHEGNHTGDLRFSCAVCREVFPSRYAYAGHMKTKHKIVTRTSCKINKVLRGIRGLLFPYNCEKCQESFLNETCFFQHMMALHNLDADAAKRERLVILTKKKTELYYKQVQFGNLAERGCQTETLTVAVTEARY